MKYYIYIITNKILNKQYVGSKMCYKDDPNTDGYMGSSKYLKNDYKIYGLENFIKEIIKDHYKNKKELLDAETEYILKYNTLEPNGYNRYLPNKSSGWHMGGLHHSEETKRKMRKPHKKFSEETKKKISKSLIERIPGNKGIPLTEEQKRKLSEANKGKHHIKHTEETKQKIRESLKNHNVSEETKEKIRKSNLGRIPGNKGIPLTEEQKRKLSESLKGRISGMKGKKHTEETKEKMKGKKHTEETKEKMSNSKRNMSLETKQKMSNSRRGKIRGKYKRKFGA